MTNENDKDIKEKIENILQNHLFVAIKGVFIVLDTLLSQCNSFEDFKIGVKRTVDNLTKTGEENENNI